MKYIPVKELDAPLAAVNCGQPDGYYCVNGMVYQVTNGCAIGLIAPTLVDSTKEVIDVQTSGVSESFTLKAMAMARGDQLAEISKLA